MGRLSTNLPHKSDIATENNDGLMSKIDKKRLNVIDRIVAELQKIIIDRDILSYRSKSDYLTNTSTIECINNTVTINIIESNIFNYPGSYNVVLKIPEYYRPKVNLEYLAMTTDMDGNKHYGIITIYKNGDVVYISNDNTDSTVIINTSISYLK